MVRPRADSEEYLEETGIRELSADTLGDALDYVDVLCPALRGILDAATRVNTALSWSGTAASRPFETTTARGSP